MAVMISNRNTIVGRNQRLVKGWLELGQAVAYWLWNNLTASSMRACRLSVAARVVRHFSLSPTTASHPRCRAARRGIEIKTLCGLGYCATGRRN